jgi:hypothetical protein
VRALSGSETSASPSDPNSRQPASRPVMRRERAMIVSVGLNPARRDEDRSVGEVNVVEPVHSPDSINDGAPQIVPHREVPMM